MALDTDIKFCSERITERNKLKLEAERIAYGLLKNVKDAEDALREAKNQYKQAKGKVEMLSHEIKTMKKHRAKLRFQKSFLNQQHQSVKEN